MNRLTTSVLVLLMGTAAPALAAVEGGFERTLTVTGAVTLSATSGSGGIDIATGPDGSVHVKGVIRANSWGASSDEIARAVKALEANPPIVQQGNTVRIGEIEDERIARLVSVSYTITVPRQTSVTSKTGSGSQSIASLAGPVSASSGSGGLTVAAIDGAVDVRTGSGSIRVERAGGGLSASSGSGSISVDAAAGDMRVRTGSGSIEVRQAASNAAEVSSGSGHIRVSDLKGGIKATTASAGIEITGTPTADWRTSTSSGSIRLEIPADASFRLDAHTSSGSIRTDHTLNVMTTGRRELTGTVGTGGVLVEARSSSGSITVGRR
jgi:Putative adhesin